MKLPGLIDVHVHLREPGAEHKEDWSTGTAAALAGGFTMVCAMPNTTPALTDRPTLDLGKACARARARCDYAIFLGAGPHNTASAAELAPEVAGLKLYLNATFGDLRLDDLALWMDHFERWPANSPLAVHAEVQSAAAAILLADLYDRPVHVCHVARREEIQIITKAKERGLKVTCEVAPHHLVLSEDDIPRLGAGRAEVRPRLATPEDRKFLWDHLDVIDCFATDHAPHTVAEKESTKPPPGFPGLETALPILLRALHDGRLTEEDLVARLHTRPLEIFGFEPQPDTWVEIDPDVEWSIPEHLPFTRCGWTPFAGMKVRGRVRRVVLRGQDAFVDGQVVAPPGSGQDLRPGPHRRAPVQAPNNGL